jgi:hypothetical protein
MVRSYCEYCLAYLRFFGTSGCDELDGERSLVSEVTLLVYCCSSFFFIARPTQIF